MSELNYEGLEFPLKITDVPKLEKMNPDISINVLFYENRNPFPLYNSPHRYRNHHVNLLLIMNDKTELLIRSLSRLVGDRTKHTGVTHVCPYYLYCFSKEVFWYHTYLNVVFILLNDWNIHQLNMTMIQNTTSWSSKTLPKLCLCEWYYIATLKHFSSQWKTMERRQRLYHKNYINPVDFPACALLKIPSTPDIFLHTVDQM